MKTSLIVLNYNGRDLLEECMPSILEAADVSRHETEVIVIDNSSTDDSIAWLEEAMPTVRVISCPNRGLCSFNEVVATLDSDVVILLNNDIKMHRDSVDPMCNPLDHDVDENSCYFTSTGKPKSLSLSGSPDGAEAPLQKGAEAPVQKNFMVAPKCLRFDDESYEGFRTAIWWKLGILRATALFPGHESHIDRSGLSASVGAVMAVDRLKFLELDGFDPLYLPGRLEDLDLAFRAFLRGYTIRYEPISLTWHRGMATFAKAFGSFGCDQLALRNTLLFQWKNLRTPANVLRQIVGLTLRLPIDWLRLPVSPRGQRLPLTRALLGALARLPQAIRSSNGSSPAHRQREREFFKRFSPESLRNR